MTALRLPPLPRVSAVALLALLAACNGGAKPENELSVVDNDEDGYPYADDCNDDDPDVHPDAEERCNEIDDDCDDAVDEELATAWYRDDDGDGYGPDESRTMDCEAPAGFVPDGGDCDDDDDDVHPGADELCNAEDDDCDGLVDEDAIDALDWYADGDGDGYGAGDVVATTCTLDGAYSTNDDDCEDGDDTVFPGAVETCNDVDDDCNDLVDDVEQPPRWYQDLDGDGFGDPAVYVDECDPGPGWVGDDTDCDDQTRTTNPDGVEVCNGVDDDCDGSVDDGAEPRTWYRDADTDGYGNPAVTTESCDTPRGYVSDADDCDDTRDSVNPAATEVCDDLLDNDCDGTTDEDCGGGGGDPTLCDGQNTGDTYDDGVSMGGPGLSLGIRFTASADETVVRVEVYTGEGSGTNTVGLWSHDSAASSPDVTLSEGSWTMSATNGWQGADLAAPVTLNGGDDYWVVWEPSNGAQASWDTSGANVSYMGSFDYGSSWFGPYSDNVKFKLYCE